MFAYLKGIVAQNHATYIILEVNNIGYKLLVPPGTISYLASEKCTLHTSLVIRELSQTLYGFKDSNSRDLFELLITINGVGPKTALCILSKFDISMFQKAVQEENIVQISSVPGIGKKTAERLIIDIKDKLNRLETPMPEDTNQDQHHLQDAMQALMNLGFTQINAKKAIEKVIKNTEEQLELSEIITHALRNN